MKRKLSASQTRLRIVVCIVGFHLLLLLSVLLFGRILPSFFVSDFLGKFHFILYPTLVFVLYLFRYKQVNLWKQFFSSLLPEEKQVPQWIQLLLQIHQNLEKKLIFFMFLALGELLLFIMLLLFSSISTLLLEVYWLTDFSLAESIPIPFMVAIWIFSEIAFVFVGWFSNFQEAEEQDF